MKKTLLFLTLLCLSFTLQGQDWQASETRQANTRENAINKRMSESQSAMNGTADQILKRIHQDRIDILNYCRQDIQLWKGAIQENKRLIAQRYNLLANLRLGQVEAMQNLLAIRSAEIYYETRGTQDFKGEPLAILKDLRTETASMVRAYDKAINKIRALLKQQ